MKKSYKIEVDCANCASRMEDAAKKIEGVKDASVNFMLLKMKVEFEHASALVTCRITLTSVYGEVILVV